MCGLAAGHRIDLGSQKSEQRWRSRERVDMPFSHPNYRTGASAVGSRCIEECCHKKRTCREARKLGHTRGRRAKPRCNQCYIDGRRLNPRVRGIRQPADGRVGTAAGRPLARTARRSGGRRAAAAKSLAPETTRVTGTYSLLPN